ncbi:MAG: NYN domain-containing protein [Candidatus Caenarcaniphilales bacterium]|nr:NYN domain-containing protein [Candidatus Caenarcaniphilales bacterium]
MTIAQISREFGRLAVFIDGNNLFHAARSMGIEIDYAKLLGVFCKYGPLLRAFFYTGVDENASKQQGFLLWMKRNGYKVVQKELKVFPDGTKRANLDVEIVVDMLTLSTSVDTIALVSGDEDFTYALDTIAKRGKQIMLAGFRVNTSPILMDVCDHFLDLESLIDEIVKENSPGSSSSDYYFNQTQIKPTTLASRMAASQSSSSRHNEEEGILDP